MDASTENESAEADIQTSAGSFINQTVDKDIFPNIEDLAARIQFSPEKGQIWLDDRRMVLLHCDAIGDLRSDLIDQIGLERTRAVFTRMGYQAGAVDAEISSRVRKKGELFEAFSVGPQLHGLEGVVRVEEIRCEIDVERGVFDAEYIWHNSFEAEAHITSRGLGGDPVCWMQIGYASGFASAFLGRQIVYRETGCMAMGHDTCRIVGKPAEEWDDPTADLKYLMPGRFDPMSKSAVKSPARAIEALPRVADTEMVGASAKFNRAYHLLKKAAPTEACVLFIGETGVGKGLFARVLHRLSPRKGSEFIFLNCAALTDDSLDTELFGVAKNTFADASASLVGRLERAHGGTIFLSGVDQLSLSAQAKLLQFLQTGQLERVGGRKGKQVNVRVLASTQLDLSKQVKLGKFRQDLFYRLNIFPIYLAPIRERRADLSLLLEKYLNKSNTRHFKQITGFTERALAAAMAYNWPGNIREVENRIERAVILCEDNEPISFSYLFLPDENIDLSIFRLNSAGSLEAMFDGKATPDGNQATATAVDAISQLLDNSIGLDDVTDLLIRQALQRTTGNQSAAARLLGMTRAQIQYRVKQMQSGGE